MSKTTVILIISIMFCFGILAGLFISNLNSGKNSITGRVVEEIEGNYSYTTAICNEKKECIDVKVSCVDGELKSLEPISDLKRFYDDWEDPRNRKENEFCK